MSIKRGVIGFGMSATIIAGGVAAVNKAEDEMTVIRAERVKATTEFNLAKSCEDIANMAKTACRDVVKLPDSVKKPENVDSSAAIPYGIMGGVALFGGAVGTFVSLYETLGGMDEELEPGLRYDED